MPQIDLGLVIGPQGPQGQTGQTGATGPEGPQGPAGLGLPSGGTAGDVLVKQSSTDYSTSWSDEVLHPVYEASFTIATSAWAVTSPYTYTWTDSHVTASSSVSVYFDDSATHAGTPYIEFEKVSGGIQFTALAIPSAAIPVHVKIFRARASSLTDLEADMVATDAISGAENVEEALGSVGDSIASLNSKIAKYTTSKTMNGLTFQCAKYLGICVITISAGSNTNAINVSDTLFSLSDFNINGAFAISSQANYTYGVTGRMSCGAGYSNVDTNTAIPAGTSLRGTIVCVLE